MVPLKKRKETYTSTSIKDTYYLNGIKKSMHLKNNH